MEGGTCPSAVLTSETSKPISTKLAIGGLHHTVSGDMTFWFTSVKCNHYLTYLTNHSLLIFSKDGSSFKKLVRGMKYRSH